MTLAEWAKSVLSKIVASKIQCADPVLHAKQILSHLLGMEMSKVIGAWDDEIESSQLEPALSRFLERRLSGEPFQYITGHEWFWNSRFEVGPGVLIPRRDTEIIVEHTLSLFPANVSIRVAELGPGSGNIGISLLQERPSWHWFAIEKNPESVPYLERNRAQNLPPSAGYFFIVGDFFEEAAKQAPYDLIISNPPYISTEEMKTLPLEVQYEPRLALESGAKGLDTIAQLAQQSLNWLAPGGLLVTEIGAFQEKSVMEIFSHEGYVGPVCIRDYAGLPRVASGARPK